MTKEQKKTYKERIDCAVMSLLYISKYCKKTMENPKCDEHCVFLGEHGMCWFQEIRDCPPSAWSCIFEEWGTENDE